MNRLILAAVLLVLVLPPLLSGCQRPEPSATQQPVSQPPPVQTPVAEAGGEGVGENVPDFTVTDIDGKSHSPSDYKGRVLVIDFWATYCKPCVKKLNEYALDATLKGPDVAILALSMDESDEVIRGWRKQQGDEFGIPLVRLDPETRKAFFGDAAIVPIPQVRVVDGAGVIRYSFGADSTTEQLKEAVKTLQEQQ